MINDKISDDAAYGDIYYAKLRIPLLQLLDKPPGRVLEVGCGSGLTLEYLKDRGATEVVGVELRGDVVRAIRQKGKIDRVWQMDVVTEEIPEEDETFNTIVLSHVLEHFARPQDILARLARLAAPEARYLIAVPNVRHLSVLVPLIVNGDFTYRDSGIMDHTHLRFFTRNSVCTLLEQAGLRANRVEPEITGRKSNLFNAATFGLFRDFAAYAFNILATHQD